MVVQNRVEMNMISHNSTCYIESSRSHLPKRACPRLMWEVCTLDSLSSVHWARWVAPTSAQCVFIGPKLAHPRDGAAHCTLDSLSSVHWARWVAPTSAQCVFIGPKFAHPRDGAAEKSYLACPSRPIGKKTYFFANMMNRIHQNERQLRKNKLFFIV